jgi:uncharacterized protein (DUF305 family)
VKRFQIAAVTVGLLLLAGCGSSGEAGIAAPSAQEAKQTVAAETKSAAFNPADVMFLQMMIPHHGQGMEMVRLAKKQATRTEIQDLVTAIELTQADEVENMAGWLKQWGQPETADPNASAHANHGGMPATSPEVIADLAKAKGKEFESKFLNFFTGHQGAAVEMARTQMKDGASQPVKDLADRIVKSRTGQIQQMLTLLGQQ